MARILSNNNINELGLWKRLADLMKQYQELVTSNDVVPIGICDDQTLMVLVFTEEAGLEQFYTRLDPLTLRVQFKRENDVYNGTASFGKTEKFLLGAIAQMEIEVLDFHKGRWSEEDTIPCLTYPEPMDSTTRFFNYFVDYP